MFYLPLDPSWGGMESGLGERQTGIAGWTGERGVAGMCMWRAGRTDGGGILLRLVSLNTAGMLG